MTNAEFSNAFSTLLNSYFITQDEYGEEHSKREIVLDEYEKSLFLTMGQEQFVIGMYTGRNFTGKGFEETEELREYLSPIIKEKAYPADGQSFVNPVTLPEDLWFILYEQLSVTGKKCEEDTSLDVFPVTLDEYDTIKNNPFRGANNRRALRIGPIDNKVKLISKFEITGYKVTYLRQPNPIILETLGDGVTINDEFQASECELPSSTHQKILEIAVGLALQSRGYNRDKKK